MDYINIIEITDRKARILFDNEKHEGKWKVTLTEKNKEKYISQVTFEEAKKIVFEKKNEISFIQMETESSFNKEEFILLTFFENFTYLPKDFTIYSQKDHFSTIANGSFHINATPTLLYIGVDIIKKELLKYQTLFPYIFNKNGINIKNQNGYLVLSNEKEKYFLKENETIFLKDNKITRINLENLEEELIGTIEKKEFSKKEFEIRILINDTFLLLSRNNNKFNFVSSFYGFNISYENEKKEISCYYNESNTNKIEVFKELFETLKKIIGKYSNDDFNKIFENFLKKIEEKIQQIKEEERKEQLAEQNFETEFKKRMAEINI